MKNIRQSIECERIELHEQRDDDVVKVKRFRSWSNNKQTEEQNTDVEHDENEE